MSDHGRRRDALSRDAIVAVARRLADQHGIEELTLRRLAADLGTGQASLYRHIADRKELLDLLAADLAAHYPLLAPDGPPVEVIVEQWTALYRYLDHHLWGVGLIAAGGHRPESAERVLRHCLDQLRRAGFDETDSVRTYRALWTLLLGHLLNRHPFGHLTGTQAAARPAEADLRWTVRRLLAGVTAAD